jgi:hypothetical protein
MHFFYEENKRNIKINKFKKSGKKFRNYLLQLQRAYPVVVTVKVKVKLSLCLMTYHVIKACHVLNRTPRREYESEENNTLYVF